MKNVVLMFMVLLMGFGASNYSFANATSAAQTSPQSIQAHVCGQGLPAAKYLTPEQLRSGDFKTKDTLCNDGSTRCGNNNTCCGGSKTPFVKSNCCSFAGATCCNNGVTCCPSDYPVCSPSGATCYKR